MSRPKKSVATKIREMRNKHPDMSGYAIAKHLKVSKGYVWKVLTGYKQQPKTTTEKLVALRKSADKMTDEIRAEVRTSVKKSQNANKRQVGGSHYVSLSVEPWDAMEAWMTKDEFIGFLKGNVIKYLARTKNNNDIDKAGHYMQKLLEVRWS